MVSIPEKYYTTLLDKGQHKIFGLVERDTGSLRLSALVMIQLPDGRVSEPVSVQRSRLVKNGEKELDWLFDCEGNFNEDDLDTVRDRLLGLLEKPEKITETGEKMTQEEVWETLMGFVRSNTDEITNVDGKTITAPDVFTKEDRIYIKTTAFDRFIEENKTMGWKCLEVLKMLKRYNLLDSGKNRTYDKKVRINGNLKNYYVVRISKDGKENLLIEEEPDEDIEIKESKRK